jgi:uncharacterized protein YjbI with pentapeptide repeats
VGKALIASSLVAITGVVAVVGVASGRGPSAPGHGVNVTIGADEMSLVTGRDGVRRLQITKYAPGAELTGMSPSHDRLRVPTAVWARGWKRLYGTTEPNAVIAYGRGASVKRLSVSLASMKYNPVTRTMSFALRPMAPGLMTRPPLVTAATRAQAGTRQRLGAGQLYVDQTADFGSNTAAQDQNAVTALDQAGMGVTVTSQNYLCCNSGMQPPQIENALSAGEAYGSLMLQPGTVDTITFTGAPAFGGSSLSGIANITFANGEDTDGATFGLSGPGAFTVAKGSTVNFGLAPNAASGEGGTEGLVIYNGDFNGTVAGALGANSALVGGDMDGATVNGLVTNDALIAGVSFDGANFSSNSGTTSFNDTALVGVSFEGATINDVLVFNGTALVPLSVPSPTGEATTAPTSFKNVNGNGQSLLFGPSLTNADAQSPIDGVSFAGMTGFDRVGITYAVVTNSDFSNADLGGQPTLKNTSIDNASNFTGTKFGQPIIESCSFIGTDLTNVEWEAPTFTGTADAPTVLQGVTLDPTTFENANNLQYKVTFEYTTFNGTTFTGLDPAFAPDVALVSQIMNSTGVKTTGLGLIAFNTQYVLGADGDGTPTWYSVNSAGTEWTPIDSVTLQPSGPPTNEDPTIPPEPEPGPEAP